MSEGSPTASQFDSIYGCDMSSNRISLGSLKYLMFHFPSKSILQSFAQMALQSLASSPVDASQKIQMRSKFVGKFKLVLPYPF